MSVGKVLPFQPMSWSSVLSAAAEVGCIQESSRLKLASLIVVFHSTDAEIFLQLKKNL